MFTLGLARSSHLTNDTIVIFAAASGFVVVALQIAYLPALYAAFNRRESLIAMLASRAGEPSWGPEILVTKTRSITRIIPVSTSSASAGAISPVN
jgi:hypothetical protein